MTRSAPHVDVGSRFGHLTVIGPATRIASGRGRSITVVACRCDCGNSCTIEPSRLLTGHRTRCGCRAATYKTTEYRIWAGIKSRCHNGNGGLPRYQGRGIRICSRWLASFQDFLADVGRRPAPDVSLDRRDNDGHYSCGKCEECIANGWPANCRWATRSTQQRNRSNRPVFELDGVRLAQIDWALRCKVGSGAIRQRLRAGWSLRAALTTPSQSSRKPPSGTKLAGVQS